MSILTLVYRTLDMSRWGAGKGSRMSSTEVDENFWSIQQAVNQLTSNPAEPVNIAGITTDTTNNTFTIHMSDASTFGPFALPVATLTYTGNWQATHAYKSGNLFNEDDGLYFVNRAYTSGTTFDPNAGDTNGPFAVLLVPFPTRVRVAWFWPTQPGAGLGSSATMFAYLTGTDIYLDPDLPDAIAKLEVAPTGAISFPISKNATPIGSLDFAAGNVNGTFTFADRIDFASGDVLRMSCLAGSPDATAAGLMVNISARLGVGELDSASSS